MRLCLRGYICKQKLQSDGRRWWCPYGDRNEGQDPREEETEPEEEETTEKPVEEETTEELKEQESMKEPAEGP